LFMQYLSVVFLACIALVNQKTFKCLGIINLRHITPIGQVSEEVRKQV
jgi:hypothetical protein